MNNMRQSQYFTSDTSSGNRETVGNLAESLDRLMADTIEPRYRKLAGLADGWSELLPEHIRGHCRLDGISAGTLKVVVDSPSYMYELRLHSRQLLQQIRRNWPRAGIKKIRYVLR